MFLTVTRRTCTDFNDHAERAEMQCSLQDSTPNNSRAAWCHGVLSYEYGMSLPRDSLCVCPKAIESSMLSLLNVNRAFGVR